MKTVRIIFRLLGIFLIIAGFNSCKKDKDDDKRKCNGDEFTCTYSYSDGTFYTYRFCQDGWVAYYANGVLEEIEYDSYYTTYWHDYKLEWMDWEDYDDDLTCVF